MLNLRIGTQETLLVDVEDTLGNLTTLVGSGAQYDVEDKNGNFKMQNQTVIVDVTKPMQARCHVDTTVGGNWSPGRYFLYIHYNASPDSPRLMAGEFKVNP
jgi:hypothetical protein